MLAKVEKKRKQKRSDVDAVKGEAAVKAASNEKTKVKKDKLKKKMKKKPKIVGRNSSPVDVQVAEQMEDDILKIEATSNEKSKVKKDKLKKKMKKKPKIEERNSFPVDDQVDEQVEDDLTKIDGDGVQTHKGSGETANADASDKGTKIRNRKSKKPKKKKKTDPKSSNCQEKTSGVEEDEVYQISSGEEDCSRGLKKWVTEYYTSRPGLNELQKRIDDFIIAHEERLEQERKEREAKAEEGGWTVVVHHKGRKKTTDSESGITVGSVAQAAVEDKLAKKKQKETVAPDFYRFQKREAHRNEIMALKSKFEQDKKRIQQLRAARKFKPY